MGYWLGIGFGSTSMTNSDVVMCAFRYTGTTSNDQFSCSDYYSYSAGYPSLDANDNIDDIATSTTFTTSGSKKLVTL